MVMRTARAINCTECATGMVLILNKGEDSQCDECKSWFATDYEDHDELETTETEYWILTKLDR